MTVFIWMKWCSLISRKANVSRFQSAKNCIANYILIIIVKVDYVRKSVKISS